MDTVRTSGKEPTLQPMRKSSLTSWAFALSVSLTALFIVNCSGEYGDVLPWTQPPTAVSIVPTESAPRLHDRVVEPTPSPSPTPIAAPSPAQSSLPPPFTVSTIYFPAPGSTGLNERVFYAGVIARAKLKGTKASAELAFTRGDGSKLYQGLVQFTFTTLEYLKGSGGAEVVAFATVNHRSAVIRDIMDKNARGEFIAAHFVDSENPYTSMDLALGAAKKWEKERVTTWDDREAIIMLWEQPVPGGADGSKRYWLGRIFAYAVDSMHRMWLPSATSVGSQSAGQGASETRFLLDLPNRLAGSAPAEAVGAASPAQPPTISVSEMKALSAELEQWRKDGEGVEGYEECIRQSFIETGYVNGKKERGESAHYKRFDFSIASGLSQESVVEAIAHVPGKVWLDGNDKELFDISPHSNGVIRTTRPLPAGVYTVFENYQPSMYVPCNHLPIYARNTHELFIEVTAPPKSLHEAFFDPAAISTAVGADATNGALKPASFAIDDTTTTTLDSIAWESRRATIKVSPAAVPANHHVDFIALDGSVALRLDVDDATKSVDSDDTTLTWGVCKQPWVAGDKLMLRISKSPADLTGATNDTACDGTPIPTLTPVPTPTPIPSPTPAPTATPAAGAPKATLLGNGGIRLTWGAETGATQYKIAFRTPGSSWGWSELGGPKITTNSQNMGIYACGITLIFRVRAKLGNGNWGNWSPASSPYTKPCP